MSKNRYINTKFWSDTFIVELNPLDRYLFLYLLTNEHTNICGIYELPWRVMARETGLDDEMLRKMFKRLSNKIYYLDGWIYVKNFAKHQRVNESVEIGIKNALKEIPEEIIAKVKQIDTASPQTGDRRGTASDLSKPKSISKLILKPESKSILAASAADIVSIMEIFQTINPMLNYGNTAERNAVTSLIEKIGIEKTMAAAKYAASVQGQKYAPIITTPRKLKDKLGELIGYRQREDSSKKGIVL